MADNYANITGEFVGVGDVYFAMVTEDNTSGYTAGTPEMIAPLGRVACDVKTNTKTRYYGDKPLFTSNVEGVTDLTLVIPGLPLSQLAKYVGKAYDETAKRFYDTGALNAPKIAVGFDAHIDGGTRFYWFLNCKLNPPKMEAETMTENINEKTTELTLTALPTVYDGFMVDGAQAPCKRVVTDTMVDPTVTASEWFGAVQTPEAQQ